MIRDTRDMFDPPDRGRFGDNESAPRRQRVTGASDLHDFLLRMKFDKPLSIGVQQVDSLGPIIWLPKSQIEYEPQGNTLVKVAIPEWLAKDKGLL